MQVIRCLFHLMTLVFIISTTKSSIVTEQETDHRIVKRDVVQLGATIACAQGRSDFFGSLWILGRYSNYGCYCGIGGHGTPRDESDRCCQHHDQCYSDYQVKCGNCGAAYPPYKYKCEASKVTCQDEDDSTLKFLCECDKELADCLNKNKEGYSRENVNVRNSGIC